jgi:saccharopine dehydrogenase (NADP+, L-glutamate forming)
VSDRSVLVLGAGFVAGPVVRYLLEKTGARVRIASLEGAEELAAGHERAEAVPLDAGDEPRIEELARDADLVVSLLPPPFHPRVARIAVRLGKPMVTTSYVGDEMRALDEEARGAGVILINEVGVDPGLDHMTALRTLDRIRAEGGRVVSFRSHCGGLPSAEANDNPLGYKFSWAPRGVLTAARRPARYLLDGAEIPVPGDDILGDVRPLDLGEDGVYESYPNGDAMGYVPLYGLEDAHTVYRGTLRYPGHCRAWKAMVDLGLLDEGEREVAGKTWAGLVRDLAGLVADAPVREGVAARLGLEVSEDPLVRMAWLGLFDETPVPAERAAPLDLLAGAMLERMGYAEGERDLIVMHHEFGFLPAGEETAVSAATSTMIALGEPGGDSAMARTVGLPAAVACRMVLEGRAGEPGVRIPVEASLYEPILEELEGLGITCRERQE